MQTQPAIGTEVIFSFPVHPLTAKFVGERRAGRGVVVGESVVGTDLSALIRVTESPYYAAGEVLDVRNHNIGLA